MAFYQVLYWMDIPSQIKVYDDFDETKFELGEKYIALIDKKAQSLGLTGTDDYLDQWNWSEEKEIEGEIDEVIEIVKAELESATLK